MAEFKKYSAPGSFGQNQLKRPSEVGKIEKETGRKLRSMQRAQQLEDRYRAVYLRAQQFAQSQEESQRENNFRIETENRQAYKDALQRDYKIESANAAAEASVYQRTLKDLTNFSMTAAQLAADYANSVKESNNADAKENIYKAGLTLDKLTALQGIDDNLTKSELLQTTFMQDVIASEDLTETQKDAYYKIYQGRNSRPYIENKALLQQEAGSYIGFIDAALSSDNVRNLPAEQKISLFPQIRAQFLNTENLVNQRGEILESSGLFNAMRGIENQVIQSLQQQVAKARKDKVETDLLRLISETRRNEGAQGVARLLAERRTKEFRLSVVKAYTNDSKGSGEFKVTQGDIQALLMVPTENNGVMIPFGERFAGGPAVDALNQLLGDVQRQEIIDFDTSNKLRNVRAEETIREQADLLGADGFYTKDELQYLLDLQETLGAPGFSSPTVAEVSRLTLDARATEEASKILDKLGSNNQLTVDRLMDMQVNVELMNKFGPIARRQDKARQNPEMDESIARLRELVASEPSVAAGLQLKQNEASVDFVQDRFEREFKASIAQVSYNAEVDDDAIKIAEAETAQRITEYLKKTKVNIDNRGNFVEYTRYQNKYARQSEQARRDAIPLFKAFQNPNVKKHPAVLANALEQNRDLIIDSFDSYNEVNWQPLPVIKLIADRLDMDPIGVYRFIAPAFGKQPLKFKNNTLQTIKENLPPHLRRNFDANPTDESIARSTAYMYGRTANLPVRPVFEQSGVLPLIREGESGGDYNAANRGIAGDTPAGIVNLDTLSVGSWLKFYEHDWNALGAYQLIKSTFQEAVQRLGFDRNTIMNKQNQDLIAIELIAGGTKRPALSAYVTGESDDLDAAVKDLYMEWAAISNEAGNSEYDGIAGNAANVSNDEAREALQRLRKMLISTQ